MNHSRTTMVKNYTHFTTPEEEYNKNPQLKREDVQALQDWASKQPHLPPISVEEEYNRDPQLKRKDVEILQQWIAKEPHLPEISELKLLRFLHSNYYKIEATKQCIETYYTIRANCDEIFKHHDIKGRGIRDACQMVLCNVVVSKPEYKVVVIGIHDPNPELMKSCGPVYCILDIMTQLIYAQNGASDDHIVIIDGSKVGFHPITKLSLVPTKILMSYVQHAAPVRLKAVHVVNVSPFIEKAYSIFKPFLKGELLDKIYLHKNLEDLYKYLPKDSLSKDHGGERPSLEELHAEQMKMFEANAEWIRKLGEEKTDETKRQKKINFGDMYGFEGTFKRLEID